MTTAPLLRDLQDGVLTLTLHRPDKLNAIDNALGAALLDGVHQAAADPAVRVLCVQGSGRAFCAGRDVGAPPTDTDLVLVQAVSKALVGLTKPVVFAVHGWTVGAGLEWMLNADLVIAADSSRFKLPEARLGVFVTGGLSATLTAYAGLARAKALTLLGEEFSAAQAQAWGLIWQVVPEAGLAAATQAACERLAVLRPEVARQFKRVFNEVGLAGFEHAIRLETQAQRSLAAGG
ncbi:MAG: enoyl-CoA hydratase/isomerase family protein [Proteobacteria bacterium]|nr:enoyl-CoA hydratase/isomerase family protein [Pseudomonadota bacterium]